MSEVDERDGEVFVESPLHYFSGKHSGNQPPSIVIRQCNTLSHLIVRGDPGNAEFVSGIHQALGIELPTQPCTSSNNDETRLYWLGPNEWLIIVQQDSAPNVEQKLRDALTGHFSVVTVTGGQTLINISGSQVHSLLKKSSVYDFHPSNFQVNDCVQTTFAKATALFSKREDGSFDIVIRRSFADYLATWMLDAGAEYGCLIE